jgi:hypothetical protein
MAQPDRGHSGKRHDAGVLDAKLAGSAVYQDEAEVDRPDLAEQDGQEAERVVGEQQRRDQQRGAAEHDADQEGSDPPPSAAAGDDAGQR